MLHLAVDLMGADISPEDLFQAVLRVAQTLDTYILDVITTEQVAVQLQEKHAPLPPSIKFVSASSEITMEEDPLLAIRTKRDSSLVIGMERLTEGKAAALVSAGSTGALAAASKIFLSALPGVFRPVLLATLPKSEGQFIIVDIGANLSDDPEQLTQFTKIGLAYCRVALSIKRPSVGLLNIGSEEKKGTLKRQETFRLLSALSSHPESSFDFMGNIESKEIFKSSCDLLITDGFVGNVFLKACEGATRLVLNYFENFFTSEVSPEFSLCLESAKQHFDWLFHPGGVLLGGEGIVVKCHGEANPESFYHSILGAITLVEKDILEKLKGELAKSLLTTLKTSSQEKQPSGN